MDVMGPNEHGSTFGGNPLAAEVCTTALDVLLEEGLVENSRVQGAYLMEQLKNIKKPFIKEIRGRGLFIAMQVADEWEYTAKDLCLEFIKEGILCKQTHGTRIRFSPPLIITKAQIDEILEKINKVLARF